MHHDPKEMTAHPQVRTDTGCDGGVRGLAAATALTDSARVVCRWSVVDAEARYRIHPAWEGSRPGAVVTAERPRSPGAATAGQICARFGLTPREVEVALLLSERRSAREIARALKISVHTVRRHTEKVFGKLNVHRRQDVGGRLQEGGS